MHIPSYTFTYTKIVYFSNSDAKHAISFHKVQAGGDGENRTSVLNGKDAELSLYRQMQFEMDWIKISIQLSHN